MINVVEKQFDKLAKKIKVNSKKLTGRLGAYVKRLLFPLYFFPIKLITYSAYYLVKFSLKLTVAFVKILIDTIIYPFRSLKNFLKSIFILAVMVYMAASLFVIADYLRTQYGQYGKFLCSFGVRDAVKDSVVRVVGGLSEGSGFFIASDQVLTNFHVIDGEPSPKIIFPDGHFVTPTGITANKDADLALLSLPEGHPEKVMEFTSVYHLEPNEPILSVGYALGTDLAGEASVVGGHYISRRFPNNTDIDYLQTDSSLIPGMSGGPTVDRCGEVVGVNTISLAGLSLVISSDSLLRSWPSFTTQDIQKIEVDPSLSPADAVTSFYTYLKARKMQDGFNLLSQEYRKKTNFQEWTGRFTDILDVTIILAEEVQGKPDTVLVKFSTKNWVDGEAITYFYEGTWQTVKEEGVYKMLKSNIKEVEEPDLLWFYE